MKIIVGWCVNGNKLRKDYIEGKLKVVPSSMEGKNTFIDYVEKGEVSELIEEGIVLREERGFIRVVDYQSLEKIVSGTLFF